MSSAVKTKNQKLSLDIDFENFSVKGSTVIEVEQEQSARYLCLNAQQLDVDEVFVADRPARLHRLFQTFCFSSDFGHVAHFYEPVCLTESTVRSFDYARPMRKIVLDEDAKDLLNYRLKFAEALKRGE